MKNYEITFEWQNGDWTWIDVEANDYHQAMLIGLDRCPLTCRVHSIQFFTREQVEASRKAKADILARQETSRRMDAAIDRQAIERSKV
jgi:hypothetical protein